MSYEKLLSDLQATQDEMNAELTKSTQAAAAAADGGDKKIAAAASEAGVDPALENKDGGEGGSAAAPAGKEAGAVDPDEEDEDQPLGKSFKFTLEDGTEVEAQDGTELVKSLIARADSADEAFTKAIGATVDLIRTQGTLIKSQGTQITSLQETVAKLSTQGRGRKAVLSVIDKPSPDSMQKSHRQDEGGITAPQLLAKSLEAQRAGKITGLDVSRVESALNQGVNVPPDILARIIQ